MEEEVHDAREAQPFERLFQRRSDAFQAGDGREERVEEFGAHDYLPRH